MAQYNLGRVIGTMWYVGSASSDTAIKAEISGEERKPLEDDCYLNISTGDIYQYEDKGSSLEWTLKGNIKGPTGETGADGEKGKDGAPGVAAGFGEPTASATVLAAGESPTVRVTATGGNTDKVFEFEFGIPKGADGKNGVDGKTGPAGEDGTDGATWTSGTSAPSNTNGTDGDFYLNTSNWDVYKKASGSWSKVGNIKGATGADGKTPTLSINANGELIATFE